MLFLRPAWWWSCLLTAGLAGVVSPGPAAYAETAAAEGAAAPAWKARFADPTFRQRVEHRDGAAPAMVELDVPLAEVPAFYEWLEGQVKPPVEHKIECLLRAHLARQLNRPAEEVRQADDWLLQAAPDFPQGWFGRAEEYESSSEKDAATWAAEAAVQGMRKVDLASATWRAQLHGYRGVDWLAHAVKAGHLTEWTKAVIHALEEAPRERALPDTAALVLALLRHEAMRKEPLLCQMLLEAVAAAQPQLVLRDPQNFAIVMRDFRAAGLADAARHLARLLIFAPLAKEPAPDVPLQVSAELRGGYGVLLGLWEDTTPVHQPATQAWQILQTAMGDEGSAFAENCLQAAQAQPWNENLISHALLAQALNGGVSEVQMQLAEKLGGVGRARVALRLAAFAPPASYPSQTSGPWTEELAVAMIGRMQNGPSRASFESLLQSVESLAKSGETQRLTRVLHAAMEKNAMPRLDDLDHWERYGEVVLSLKDAQLAHGLASRWAAALDQTSQQKAHLLPLARAAIRAGHHGGAELAMLSLTLWERHHVEMNSTALLPAGEAARVGEALMACDHLEGFSRFVKGLEGLQKHRVTALYTAMTQELVALRALLEGRAEATAPAVEAWVRTEEEGQHGTTVQWQFVLPEFSANPERPLVLTTGDRDARAAAERWSDARWWKAGTALTGLARLAKRWTLEVAAGEVPTALRSQASLPSAPARGQVEVATLPASGYLSVTLRDPVSGTAAFVSQPRCFSTLPPLFANGPVPVATAQAAPVAAPDLAHVPQPASWQAQDTLRWGRVVAPPVPVEDGVEYLFSEWPTQAFSPLRLILLDAEQRPLGPVPVTSMGWTAQPSLLQVPASQVWRQRVQRFRPSDWAGDGDVVFPSDGRAGEQKARYMAFVTRQPQPKTFPLVQVRPYRVPAGQGPALISASPQLPELNDEYVGELGFSAHAWHVTFASDRGIITGKGALAGFDVTHIPWKPLVRSESDLLEGNEWPMCFTQEHSMVIEPSWKGTRDLGLRFVPFDARGERYAGCRRLTLPLPTYSRGDISEWMDGAVLLVSSQRGDHPEPACAWVETDGRCHVVPLPRPPLTGRPGLEVAWWGPGGTLFTLHEDGLLFHMEHRDGLHLLKVEPGSPDDMPEGGKPGRNQRKRSYRLERPDVLAHLDKKTGAVLRRFHLPKPCEGTPMAFDSQGYVVLFTTEHEIIRVNPPALE